MSATLDATPDIKYLTLINRLMAPGMSYSQAEEFLHDATGLAAIGMTPEALGSLINKISHGGQI